VLKLGGVLFPSIRVINVAVQSKVDSYNVEVNNGELLISGSPFHLTVAPLTTGSMMKNK
jgi:hypothetical protein